MVSAANILNAKVLIVDDQEANAYSLKLLLQAAGYTDVTITTNAEEVRRLHHKNRYSLILLDLQMPGMDGFDVMKDLQAIESDAYLPVFAFTGEPAYKVQALRAGARDFISKPYDPEEVLTRIRNMVEIRLLHEEVRDAAATLERLALYDPLTGLANRRLLTDRISAAMANARRSESAMALVYLDLDGFKQINDTLGHAVGDAVLKMVADRLLAVVREEDTVARMGGDEFVIALWHVSSANDAASAATKLIRIVSRPYDIDGQTVTVTTSAGVGIYPAHGADADSLIRSADLALNEAKRAGKNVFRIAEQTDPSAAPRS